MDRSKRARPRAENDSHSEVGKARTATFVREKRTKTRKARHYPRNQLSDIHDQLFFAPRWIIPQFIQEIMEEKKRKQEISEKEEEAQKTNANLSKTSRKQQGLRKK